MKSLHIFSLLLLLFSSLSGFCQNAVGKGDKVKNYPIKPTIDRSVFECIYSHKVYDPHFARTEERFWILEEGMNYSKYSEYARYRVDSTVIKDFSCRISLNNLNRLQSKYGIGPFPVNIIKNKKNTSLIYRQTFLLEGHRYEEAIPDFGWKFVGGVDTICGYACRKAECDFRGRKWTAWYADIPSANGPWKFHGLPGLILRVEDSTKEHIFEATQLRNGDTDIRYKNGSADECSTREKFNRMYNEFMTNTNVFLTGSDIPVSGGTKFVDRLFYNAIETSDLE